MSAKIQAHDRARVDGRVAVIVMENPYGPLRYGKRDPMRSFSKPGELVKVWCPRLKAPLYIAPERLKRRWIQW